MSVGCPGTTSQVLSEITGSNTISYTYGDDLISQSNNGQTSYYHYDGLGSTRQLSNGAGTITDSYDYQAFGKLLNQTGNTVNNYLFTGEQFDKNLDQYYLRARYYNQNTGRFTQQDTYAGNGNDPVTLHKYLYANADGVNNIDPSGNYTLSNMSASANIGSMMQTMRTVGVRQLMNRAATGSMRVARVAMQEAKRCVKSPNKCRLDINVLVVGSETPETSQHIFDAQIGAGSGEMASPFWLSRIAKRHPSGWIRNHDGCKGKVGKLTGKSCDEYPYASTAQGGYKNSLRVSLKPVPVAEQSLQGGLLGGFYSFCGVSKVSTSSNPLTDKSSFLTLATPNTMGFPLCLKRK